jgi:BCD family chlorophyll transporter-like MFS transporter
MEKTKNSENLSLTRNMKFGLFHIGSSMADILASGVWNRIAIKELGLASTPIALLLSLKYFLTPLSIWIGQRSDVAPFRGYRRVPYIWGGRLLMVLSYFMLGLSTVSLADDRNSMLGWLGLMVAFSVFSIGSALSGTTFLALIYDVTPEKQRTRAVSIVWFFLIIGFAASGILYGRLLPTYTRESFLILFAVAPLIMGALWFFSLFGEEKPISLDEKVANKAEKRPFWQDFQTAWENRQTRVFFVFLALSTLFFYAQDVILEPFAGHVFEMPASTTSRFSAYWGSLALIGILGSLWAMRRFPTRINNTTLTRWGVITLIIAFGMFFICAVMQIRPLVTIGLMVMGVGLGMWTVGTLGLMMDMTRAWGAGLYLALWTVAETLARGVGVVLGGVINDLVFVVAHQHTISYGAVFLIETIGFAVSLMVLNRINVSTFKQEAPAPEIVFSASMD